MPKILIIVTICAFSTIAQAGAYHDPENNAAVIYYMQDANTVNALYCNDLDKNATLSTMKALKSNSENYDKAKCEKLSEKGITKESLAEIISALKRELVDAYTQLNLQLNKLFSAMVKQIAGDKPDVEAAIDESFSNLNDAQRTAVESINADNLFGILTNEATSPVFRNVSIDLLEDQINEFRRLAN